MIINGASRANGAQLGGYLVHDASSGLGLGGYLTDQGENEQIRVLQMFGVSADDVVGGCIQMDAYGPRHRRPGRKSLYHMQINPEAEYEMSDDDWLHAADVAGQELGLQGQPRIIILHTKKGRTHAHIVYQRTHIRTLKIISDGWNYISHERAARRLEKEFGQRIVPGVHVGPTRKRKDQTSSYPTYKAKDKKSVCQARAERKAHITSLYRSSDTPSAFISALSDSSYTLAKGDRRGFVVVDTQGKVHSLARQIEGMRAAALREYFTPLTPEHSPTVDEVLIALERKTTHLSLPDPPKKAPPLAEQIPKPKEVGLSPVQRYSEKDPPTLLSKVFSLVVQPTYFEKLRTRITAIFNAATKKDFVNQQCFVARRISDLGRIFTRRIVKPFIRGP